MATKTVVTRIKNKVDTLAKWTDYTGTLLNGEIALVRVPTGETYKNPVTGKSEPVVELLMKVGDGTTAFASLPWLSAKASDVYNWAKKQNLELGDMPMDDLMAELKDTFYTESEVDSKLATKSDNHDHPYLSNTVKYAGSSSAGGAATSANKVNKAVTFTTTGGAAKGTTFNGSAAVTVDYSTVGAAPATHTHDDLYYTESEVDAKLATKSDKHNHPYLPDTTTYAGSKTKGGAATSADKVNQKVTFKTSSTATTGTDFDGSAAVTVDYSTVGAAPASHNHDDLYYTESEIDSKISTLNTAINGKAASDHNHDTVYIKPADVDTKINTALSSALKYKGTKANTSALPTSGNATGDVWNITNACAASGTLPKVNAGDNVAWNGTAWDVLAGTVDLSSYYTKSQVDSELAKKSDNHNHPYLSNTVKYAGSSSAGGAATSANKVNSSLKVQLNSGTTEGTSQFTFDGSVAKTVNVTPGAIGAYTKSEVDGELAKKAPTHDHPYLPDTTTYAGSKTKGGAANSVANSLKVQLKGGTTEGTDQFTFDGSAAKTINITVDNIGAAPATHTHDDLYYTEAEIDSKLSTKSDNHNHPYLPDTTLYAASSSKGGKATGAVTADKVANSLTFKTDGTGATASNATFNGSAAKVISYNTIGAASSGHTHSAYEARMTILEGNYVKYDTTTQTLRVGLSGTDEIIFDCGGAE